jgi:hypothetical protein
MDAGLQKVNRVCDLAEKILPNTSSDGKRIIEQQVTELTDSMILLVIPYICLVEFSSLQVVL